MNELIKINLPDVTQEISLENEWFQKRDVMLAEAQGYTVATANNADIIGEAVRKLGKMARKIEAERKKLTAPFLTAQKTIKAVVDKATEPIAAETMRLKELLSELPKRNASAWLKKRVKRKWNVWRVRLNRPSSNGRKKELFGSSMAVTIIEPEQPQQDCSKIDGVRLSEAVIRCHGRESDTSAVHVL